MDEKIELMVQPVGYNDKNFDKFDYYHAIGSWEMAEQIHEETKEQLRTATEQLSIAIGALKDVKTITDRINQSGQGMRVKNIAQQALTKIEEVK